MQVNSSNSSGKKLRLAPVVSGGQRLCLVVMHRKITTIIPLQLLKLCSVLSVLCRISRMYIVLLSVNCMPYRDTSVRSLTVRYRFVTADVERDPQKCSL